jgi:hypothetical protein
LAQPDERAVQRKAVAQLYFGVAPGHSARLIEELVVAQARDEGAVAQRLAVG